MEWFKTVFLPNTRPNDPKNARLLVIDGHKSYTTPGFMLKCFVNNVYIIYLPAHTFHVFQPLDLAVFSVFKEAYRRRFSSTAYFNNLTVVGKRLFLQNYRFARQKALTIRIITNGWYITGLWPVNIAKPLLNPLLLENRNIPSQQQIITPPNSNSKRLKSPENPGEISDLVETGSVIV